MNRCLDNVQLHDVDLVEVDPKDVKHSKHSNYIIRITGAAKVKLIDFGVAEIFETPRTSKRKSDAFRFDCASRTPFV